jgi:hypothetical protein
VAERVEPDIYVRYVYLYMYNIYMYVYIYVGQVFKLINLRKALFFNDPPVPRRQAVAERVEPEEQTLGPTTTHDTAAAAPNHRKDGEGSIEQRLCGICISTEKGLGREGRLWCSCIIIERMRKGQSSSACLAFALE